MIKNLPLLLLQRDGKMHDLNEPNKHIGFSGETPAEVRWSQDSYLIPAHTSYNFKVAKVIAILTVAAGHFLHLQGFWIAVTAGLFVFAFSSGYFTSLKYHD